MSTMTSGLRIDDLLRTAVDRDASDIHIKSGSPPLLRIYGELIPTDLPALSSDEAKRLSYSILTPQEREQFEKDWELDLGYDIEGLARFRVNVMVQRSMVGSVFRIIPLHVQTIEELALPDGEALALTHHVAFADGAWEVEQIEALAATVGRENSGRAG